jgi:hypothetical protein
LCKLGAGDTICAKGYRAKGYRAKGYRAKGYHAKGYRAKSVRRRVDPGRTMHCHASSFFCSAFRPLNGLIKILATESKVEYPHRT